MTKNEANETYLFIKEKVETLFTEWSEQRKRKYLDLIRKKLRREVDNGE